MDDRDALLDGYRAASAAPDLFDDAAVLDALDAHLLVLAAPAPQLALDVAVVAREAAEPDRVDVDGVQGARVSARSCRRPSARRYVEGRLGLAPRSRRMAPSTNSMT